jgi:signal transduction histidine kinase
MRVLKQMQAGEDDAAYWPLQVMMDTLATAQNIPLRCISSPHAGSVFHQRNRLGDSVRKHFRSEVEFLRCIAEIARNPMEGVGMIRRDRRVWDDVFSIDPMLEWVTIPSFSSPLLVLLRESKIWSIWETIWCVHHALATRTQARSEPTALYYGGPFGEALHCARLSSFGADFVLFAGPTWQPWPPDFSPSERREACEAMVRNLLGALALPPKDFADGISYDRIMRNVLSREPLTQHELSRRLMNAVRALDAALSTDIPEIPLAAREYEALALHYLELTQHPDMLAQSARELVLPTGVHTRDRPPDAATTILRVSTPSSEMPARTVGEIVRAPKGSAVAPSAAPTAAYLHAYGSLCERTHINLSNYMLEHINLLRLWLQAVYLARPITVGPSEPTSSPKVLDRLSRRLMLLFGADACNIYQYDTIEGRLVRRGSFVRYFEANGSREEAAKLMEAAGSDPLLRERSICYRCIDTGTLAYTANARDDEMLTANGQTPPRHILVIPLKIRDRTWGAIEIQALHPYQLQESLVRWAYEVTRAITPIIYDRLLLQKLSEMNDVVLSELPVERKYELILKDVASLMLASSGALYLQHTSRTGEYACRASFGRTFEPGQNQLLGFASDDPHSISATLLHQTKIGWATDRIGKSQFDEAWLTKPKNRQLQTDGHKYIAIFSLVDSNGNSFGSITVTSKSEEAFGKTWANLVSFLSKHVGVLVESVKKQADRDEERIEYEAHAVKTRTDRVIGAVDQIRAVLAPFFDNDQLALSLQDFLKRKSLSSEDILVADSLRTAFQRLPQPGRPQPRGQLRATGGGGADARAPQPGGLRRQRFHLEKVLDDLADHARALRVAAAFISGGDNMEDPAFALARSWDGTPADLRACLLSALKPLSAAHVVPMSAPPISALPWGVRVHIPPTQLQEIFNNLIDNCYKYNFLPDVAPIANCRIIDNSVILEFQNMAPSLSEEDRAHIGTARFRAQYAKDKNSDGAGLGIAFCRQEAERWGANLAYTTETRNEPGRYVWHKVRLTFPKQRVRFEKN